MFSNFILVLLRNSVARIHTSHMCVRGRLKTRTKINKWTKTCYCICMNIICKRIRAILFVELEWEWCLPFSRTRTELFLWSNDFVFWPPILLMPRHLDAKKLECSLMHTFSGIDYGCNHGDSFWIIWCSNKISDHSRSTS